MWLRSRGTGRRRRRGTRVGYLLRRSLGRTNQPVDDHRPRKHSNDEGHHGHETEKGELTSRHETSGVPPRCSPSTHSVHLVEWSKGLDLGSTTSAQSAIDVLDTALTSVNSFRATFGAVQNRLDSPLNAEHSARDSTPRMPARRLTHPNRTTDVLLWSRRLGPALRS